MKELDDIVMILPEKKYMVCFLPDGDLMIFKKSIFGFKIVDCMGLDYEAEYLETEKKNYYLILRKTKIKVRKR